MVGSEYWATGIVVWCVGRDEWSAQVEFFDGGFCDSASTEGVLRCRYAGPLEQMVDTVKEDAEAFGILWRNPAGTHPGVIYYRGDGEHTDIPPAPADWRERISAEAKRIGWEDIYTRTPAALSPSP